MNVMNRKLFANRNARRRLANMGGIMVSSPELMQAAQMFQTGGQATVLKTVAHPFGDYDIMSDGSAILKMTGSVLDPNNKGNTALLEELRNLPAKGTETNNKVSNILSGIFGGGGGEEVLEVSTENPYQADIDAAVESYTGASTNENNVPVFPPTDEQVEEVKKKVDEPIVLPEIEVTGGPEELTPEEKETASKNLENLDSAISNLETGTNVAEAGLSAALENSGVETKDLSLKQKVESMEDLFAGIFGETDEDTKKANLLTAAYTFFQIAAGASPNALTNIANGMALGIDKLIKDTEARKGRGDKVKMLALEQVLGDERLEKKFGYDKILAGLRASGQSGFRKPADFSEAVRQEVDRLSKLMGNIGKSDQELYNQAVANISKLPAYKGMTMNTDDFSSNPNIPTVEEYIKQNKILNPDYSEDEIRDMYNKRFPNVGSKT